MFRRELRSPWRWLSIWLPDLLLPAVLAGVQRDGIVGAAIAQIVLCAPPVCGAARYPRRGGIVSSPDTAGAARL